EIGFAECYSNNPLVNVMCLGILRREQLVLARSGPAGTVAVLLGAGTGRDGIGGASVLASASLDGGSGEKRPSVQVGDPFEEKKLIEACLELYERALVVGVQDLGAAGLSCATSEPVARSGMGIEVDLDRVHVRESGMSAAELLMSESQERMMAFVEPDKVNDVLTVAAKWEIDASVIGKVAADGQIRVRHQGELVAELPANSLVDGAPRYRRPSGEPPWMEDLWANTIKFMAQPAIATSLLQMLDDPALASKAWAYQQYDHMLFLNTVIGPGHDASLLRVKDTSKALALSIDGDGRLCYLDPRRGAARLVYEGALQVALAGARPMAVVDNLNLGNPEKSAVMWQLRETIEGISEACEELGIPVIGGNVSLYNETNGIDIYPTPVVGVLGLADPMPSRPPRLDRAAEGMELWIFGGEWAINLAGSAFELVTFAHMGGRPTAPDPAAARAAIAAALWITEKNLAVVAHDISAGGLAMAVAEICIASGVGANVRYSDWRHLFCEDPHRFVAAIPPQAASEVAELATGAGLPAAFIGTFGGSEIIFDRKGVRAAVDLQLASRTWRDALASRLG
ncbi:MAG: phosphoribosylformylglycinamidine synthase subunit PurL, partial [Acidimicrobiia bacterium]|nr:phosphoribosylformylglycinamidine synthase subunit PurL [Acidimicrobiia bacterium]